MHFKKCYTIQKESQIYGLIKKVNFTILNFKTFLKYNNTETYNEGKSVVAEGFIKTLKNKIYKQMLIIMEKILNLK